MSLSSRAIVLSRESFGEADCYIQFYTKDWGLISVLAKSAKKSKRRYVGGLDLFCHDEIFLRGDPKDRPYLLELTVLNSFQGIREDLEKILAAGKTIQWVKKLADNSMPMPEIYSLLGQTLALIQQEPQAHRLDLLLLIFKLKLLALLGLKPLVENCARCSEPLASEVFFDVEVGGILCQVCSKQSSLNPTLFLGPEERTFLNYADQVKLASWEQVQFPRERALYLARLVGQFATFHTQVRLPV